MEPPVPPRLNAPRIVPRSIVLASHPRNVVGTRPITWGAGSGRARGAIVATLQDQPGRNAIGSHSGAYSVYRALAVAATRLIARTSRTHHPPSRSARFHNGPNPTPSSQSILGAIWRQKSSPLRSPKGKT